MYYIELLIVSKYVYRGRTKERTIACSLMNENKFGYENLETDFVGFMFCILV